MKKNGGLIRLFCLIVFIPFLVWLFALRNTFRLYGEKCRMQRENREILLLSLQNERRPVSDSLYEPVLSNGKILRIFEDTLSALRLYVVNYIPKQISVEHKCRLYMGRLALAGSYVDLVKMLSAIERAGLSMKVVSVDFEKAHKRCDAFPTVQMTVCLLQTEYDP